MKASILNHLSPAYPWKNQFHFFSSLNSTNDEAKRFAISGAPHGTVILADHQTDGHGRMGRSFHSPKGMGLYISILLRPDCAPHELMHLTCAAAVAACDAIESVTGLRPGIKWTNDIVWEKRKLGGILTGMGISASGNVDHVIIGIGINCRQSVQDFPKDLQNMAGSLSMVTNREIDRSKLAAKVMEALWKMDKKLLIDQENILSRYRKDCVTLNQDIVRVRGDEKRYGKAIDIDPSGALLVEFSSGKIETVNSGEVSVRGMYGYL